MGGSDAIQGPSPHSALTEPSLTCVWALGCCVSRACPDLSWRPFYPRDVDPELRVHFLRESSAPAPARQGARSRVLAEMKPPLGSLLFQVRTPSQAGRPPPRPSKGLAAAGAGASPGEPPEMAWLAFTLDQPEGPSTQPTWQLVGVSACDCASFPGPPPPAPPPPCGAGLAPALRHTPWRTPGWPPRATPCTEPLAQARPCSSPPGV